MSVQLIITLIQFGLELLKYMNKAEDRKNRTAKAKTAKLVTFTDALKQAGEGDAKSLESMFTIIRPSELPD